jgi:glycine cleavage system H lipoate-binding protein/ABC-type phosphate transport system substrate-binding protein
MKKLISPKPALILLLAGLCVSCNRDKTQEAPQQDKIVLSSSPELYALTSEWAACYHKLNPEVEIEVLQSTEPALMDNLGKTSQLSFVSNDFESEIYGRSLWKMTVGRDIIVPVMNARNPCIQKIMEQGVSTAGLARILNAPDQTTWNLLIEDGPDAPVNLYTTDDPQLQTGIAGFLETDQLNINEKNICDSQSLVASLQKDPYALGFCHLLDVTDPENQELFANLQILPIDRNGNGYMDYKEEMYASMDAFKRGVWIGKYPKKLAMNIYTVGSTPPVKETELEFLSWIIMRGHVLLDNHGFGNLPEFERLAHVKIIDGLRDNRPGPGTYTLPKEPGFFTGPLPYILAVLLLFTLLLYFSLRMRGRRQVANPIQESMIPGLAFDEEHVEVSPGLLYDQTHTWAFMEKDGNVKIGIDDFLQRVTGPLTRVKMKSPGERIKKGKTAVSIIQEGKQLDICAPVSGTIEEFNPRLTDESTLLNTSPYLEGWIYKIKPANWYQEVQFLLMGTSYKTWLKKEFQRLKEFLSESFRTADSGYAHVLQDGGEIREYILKDLGPELWEDFQVNFLDVPS